MALQNGFVLDLIALSEAAASVGDVKHSLLTEAQFGARNLGTWVLMDGRSCIGTQYATLTGNANVPDTTTEGTFLRQAKAGRGLGTFEADDNKAHRHGLKQEYGVPGNASYPPGGNYSQLTSRPEYGYTNNITVETVGGAEARPKNIAVNFFIKVNL
jgi:hypothetical protein